MFYRYYNADGVESPDSPEMRSVHISILTPEQYERDEVINSRPVYQQLISRLENPKTPTDSWKELIEDNHTSRLQNPTLCP